MINRSKKQSERFWLKWHYAGATGRAMVMEPCFLCGIDGTKVPIGVGGIFFMHNICPSNETSVKCA